VFVKLVMKMAAQNITQPYAFWGGGGGESVKLGDSATPTHGKLYQVFGEYAMSRAQAFRWHGMVSEGRTLVEDEQVTDRQHR
jgi:hypothetical protein